MSSISQNQRAVIARANYGAILVQDSKNEKKGDELFKLGRHLLAFREYNKARASLWKSTSERVM
jgi:hypothetical protein